MAKIINLTPHAVNIVAEDGTVKAAFPSEGIARASQVAEHEGELEGIELVTMKFGATHDLVITADPVRDADGRIIGCKRFALV